MKILVLNSGSSSIKYKLIDMQGEVSMAYGLVDRIGEAAGSIVQRSWTPGSGSYTNRLERIIDGHVMGMELALGMLTAADTGVIDTPDQIAAIGHRVVHGGERFRESTRIDDDVIAGVEVCIPLAPLHNPGCLAGIRTAMALFHGKPQVAVFDTAFHQSIPPRAFHYALPHALYAELGVRRYGFHGSSHSYVTAEAARLLDKSVDLINLICLHLGNGSSITAISNGRSVDTSMGMTPLAGVIMGTRSGDIDPAIIAHVADKKELPLKKIMDILTSESGLKGICGLNDLRDIHQCCAAGDERARLALDMLIHSYRHYLGAYLVELGRVDAVVFTAGIGENDPVVRRRVCENLENLGILIDDNLNAGWDGAAGAISPPESPIKVFVIPTNEELEIARQTAAIVARKGV